MNIHVRDRQGREIYLTDERWQHICEEGYPRKAGHFISSIT
jgi:hypothetical protein